MPLADSTVSAPAFLTTVAGDKTPEASAPATTPLTISREGGEGLNDASADSLSPLSPRASVCKNDGDDDHDDNGGKNDDETSGALSLSENLQEHSDLLQREARGYQIPNPPQKRKNYLSWDDYFMSVAFLSALRSKDPSSHRVGACIVNRDKRIVGIGYTGFPRNCPDEILPWNDGDDEEVNSVEGGTLKNKTTNKLSVLHTKFPYLCHAEMNAILNKCSADVVGATMYVALFPCNECAKLIIQSGISEVVYLNNTEPDSDSSRAARILFGVTGVFLRQHIPHDREVEIDFHSDETSTVEPLGTRTSTTDSASTNDYDEESRIRAQSVIRARQLLRIEAGYDTDKCPSSRGRIPKMRSDSLSWDDYFMAVAFLSAKRSKDPNTQVGACIVNRDRRIVAVGYNGFPRGCSDDVLPWTRGNGGTAQLHTKYPYVCHAETNAILNKCSADVKDSTIYVALFPCNDCAKMIIQAGIREVVFMSNKYHDTDGCRASRIMFGMAGVKLRRHVPQMRHIRLKLTGDKANDDGVDKE